jgi:hypothetical protein
MDLPCDYCKTHGLTNCVKESAPQGEDYDQHGTSPSTQFSKLSDLVLDYEARYPTVTPQQIFSQIVTYHPELSQQQPTIQSHYQSLTQSQFYSPTSSQYQWPMSSQYQPPMSSQCQSPMQYQSSMQSTQQNQTRFINPSTYHNQIHPSYCHNSGIYSI